MSHFNERHLIERTQHGDTEAFTPLVTTYQPRLYTHILGRIKNTETAKDLTQDTWLKAFRAINTFRADASFYSWLYRIAENVCIDYYRKQKVARIIEPIHDIDERRITDTHLSEPRHHTSGTPRATSRCRQAPAPNTQTRLSPILPP